MMGFAGPLAGLHAAAGQLDRAAARLARVAARPGPPGDSVELSAEVTALLAARHQAAASVKGAQAVAENARILWQIFGKPTSARS